jgi:hypothetical protein
MAVLKVRFRLCKARSRISRCGSSIAFPVVNKLPLKRLAEGLGEFNRSVQHSMDFGCCSDRRCVGVATRGTQGLSSSQKKELWERWKAGESLTEIGQALQKRTGSIHWVLKATGGFAPPQRRRSSRALGQAEREEISRGLAAGDSLRAIAARLGRAASSVSREVGRNGGARATGLWRPRSGPGRGLAVRKGACSPKTIACDRLRYVVARKLKEDWSPQQISGWLRRRYPNDEAMCTCHTRPSTAPCSSKPGAR